MASRCIIRVSIVLHSADRRNKEIIIIGIDTACIRIFPHLVIGYAFQRPGIGQAVMHKKCIMIGHVVPIGINHSEGIHIVSPYIQPLSMHCAFFIIPTGFLAIAKIFDDIDFHIRFFLSGIGFCNCFLCYVNISDAYTSIVIPGS